MTRPTESSTTEETFEIFSIHKEDKNPDHDTATRYVATPDDNRSYGVVSPDGKWVRYPKGHDQEGEVMEYSTANSNDPKYDTPRKSKPQPVEDYFQMEPIDWISTVQKAGLTEKLAETEAEQIREGAKEKAVNPDYYWAGKKAYTFIADTLVQTRKAIMDAHGLQDPHDATPEIRKEIIESMKAKLTGNAAERLSAQIPVAQAETAFINTDSINSGLLEGLGKNTRIEDVAKRFGGTSKDKLVSAFRIAESIGQHLGNNESSMTFEEWVVKNSKVHVRGTSEDDSDLKFNEISTDTAKLIEESLVDIHTNYNRKRKEFGKHQSSDPNKTKESIYDYYVLQALQKKDPEKKQLSPAEREAIKLVVDYGYKESGKQEDVPAFLAARVQSQLNMRPLPKDEKPDNSVANELFNLSYPEIVVPDAIVLNDKNEIVGVVEVKAYTKEEVKRLIAALKSKTSDNEGANRNENQELIFKNGVQASISKVREVLTPVELNSKQVSAVRESKRRLDVEDINPEVSRNVHTGTLITETITLGPPIKAEQNFAVMMGAPENLPVIVRLPEDIPTRDIAELNYLSAQAGLRNVVWQRPPLNRIEMEDVGRAMAKKALASVEEYGFGKKGKQGTAFDREIWEELAKRETWE